MANPPSTHLRSFRDYYFGVIFHPRSTFEALLADHRRLRFGLIAILINAFLYTLVYIFLTAGGGAPSVATPWLAIPKEVYYSYDRFIVAPSMLMGWILAAGVAQLLSHLFSGKGSFEDNLSAFGFAISIACLASLIHDLPDSFLGAIGLLDLRAYEVTLNSPTIWRAILLTLYGLSILWFMVLFPLGLRAAQRMKLWPFIFTGLFSYFVYQLVFYTFNR